MSIKAAAPALIVAALALVGDYSTISHQEDSRAVRESCANPVSLSNLRGAISELTQGWAELDSVYSQSVAAVMKSSSLDDTKYLKNIELLQAVRQLEENLRLADVPPPLQPDHIALRRAIAKVRTRMTTIDSIYQQFFVKPEEFQSDLSRTGLRDLAEHTTRRLGQLA
ncbi:MULTISPECIES: hypothetical protein [Pseudomonas]|uniref:hypothetical protein n=1 Tax=Pseudomonas TaxID=286 RepID=UPI000AC8EC0F|nr:MULTISPECIES: hypothetical protein [Pseudomonas]